MWIPAPEQVEGRLCAGMTRGTPPLPNLLVKTRQAGTETIRVGTDTRASSGAVYILHPIDNDEQQKQPTMQHHRPLSTSSLGLEASRFHVWLWYIYHSKLSRTWPKHSSPPLSDFVPSGSRASVVRTRNN